MRLSFLVSTERQPKLFELQFGADCFAQQQLNDMKVLTFIGNIVSSDKYGNFSVEEFADLFLEAFEKRFGRDNYSDIEQIHFLPDFVDYSRADSTVLMQKIMNALFIRGFYNICGKKLMRPQSDEPLSSVYFVYDDIKFYYSTCRNDSPENQEFINVQFARIQDKRKLQRAITSSETEMEKNKFQLALDSLETQIAKEHAELKNKILDCCVAIDSALNNPNNPHIIPYSACEDPIARKELCLLLNSIYMRRKDLAGELKNATLFTKDYFYRKIKEDKIKALTQLLESNDLATLKDAADQILKDNSSFGKNVRHGRHSKTCAVLETIVKPYFCM